MKQLLNADDNICAEKNVKLKRETLIHQRRHLYYGITFNSTDESARLELCI